MTELNDYELLAQYARTQSDAAFAALVERHLSLVYSAALRFTDNPHHAQEITQAVFIILARKAGSLGSGTVFSCWLYQTARLTAANFVRSEACRQRREEAYMESTLQPDAEAWEKIAPLLDEAMGRLNEEDRNAIVLRFFENKTQQEVAAMLKLNEAAAYKRVSRALLKLKKFFVSRGVTLSATIFCAAIAANSVQAAPAGLAATVTATATKGAGISVAMTALVKGTLKTMTWLKVKFAVLASASVLAVAGGAAVVASSTEEAPADPIGRILAIARPDQTLYEWWDLKGEPMTPGWRRNERYANSTLAILVETSGKDYGDNANFVDAQIEIPNGDTILNSGWSRQNRFGGKLGTLRTLFFFNSNPVEKLRDYLDRGGPVNVRIVRDAGPWEEIGVIREGQTIQTNGMSFHMEYNPNRYKKFAYDIGTDSAISLVSVDNNGKRNPNGERNNDPTLGLGRRYFRGQKSVFITTQGPYLILRRPRVNKLYENVAVRPRTNTNSSVQIRPEPVVVPAVEPPLDSALADRNYKSALEVLTNQINKTRGKLPPGLTNEFEQSIAARLKLIQQSVSNNIVAEYKSATMAKQILELSEHVWTLPYRKLPENAQLREEARRQYAAVLERFEKGVQDRTHHLAKLASNTISGALRPVLEDVQQDIFRPGYGQPLNSKEKAELDRIVNGLLEEAASLPKAADKESTWGFQEAAKVSNEGRRAVLKFHQSREAGLVKDLSILIGLKTWHGGIATLEESVNRYLETANQAEFKAIIERSNQQAEKDRRENAPEWIRAQAKAKEEAERQKAKP